MEKVNDFIQQTFYEQGRESSAEEVDPFDEKDDVFFDEPGSTGWKIDLQGSPVTSPEACALQNFSKSYSSSQSSTMSLGRVTLKRASRRLNPTEGLGLLKRSIEVLRRSKDVRFVEQSIRTIRELMACDFINETHILGSGVVQTVCTLLGTHVVIASLAEEICRFLAILCDCSEEARDIAGEFDAVGSLQAVMETHFELYSNTVDAAMRALGVLCKVNLSVRSSMLSSRSLEWILVCARQWRNARSLQISTFLCLERALFQQEESQQRTVSLGIFHELLYAMHRFEEDSGVQYRAMALLNTLIAYSDEYRIMSASEGAVERVVYSLQSFPQKTEVVCCAARATEYYCMNTDTRCRFAEANGAEAILDALKGILGRKREIGSSQHRSAISNCLRALGQISLHSPWRLLLFKPDRLETILSSASQYEDDCVVAECALRLFRNMSIEENDNKNVRSFFSSTTKPNKYVAEQLIPIVYSILSSKPSYPNIAEDACATLLNLCVQGRTSLVKRGCSDLLQVIQQVVEKQPDHDLVVNLAVSLVMQIR